jgi:hypothetical protein
MHRFLRVIILVAFVVVCQAMWADVIDQSFTQGGDLGTVINDCCAYVAQTYTAGLSGTLAAVSVDITGFGDPLPLDVEIRTVANGLPTTTILGETTTMNFSLSDIIAFNQAIPQVAGTQYAIVVHFDGAPPPPDAEGVWGGATGNLYPGGDDVLSFDGGQTFCFCGGQDNFDSHFITYVNEVPEPGTLLLLASGCLGGLRWIKRR